MSRIKSLDALVGKKVKVESRSEMYSLPKIIAHGILVKSQVLPKGWYVVSLNDDRVMSAVSIWHMDVDFIMQYYNNGGTPVIGLGEKTHREVIDKEALEERNHIEQSFYGYGTKEN